VVVEQASRLGLEAVCVQPLLVGRAREGEDFTRDKGDDKDALLIARLTTQLHCYLPERPTAAWARLRHLGNRRVEQLALATAAQQRLRDLLECAWPAALEVARHPLDSLTWRAAMTVGRCDPVYIRRLGRARFARAVARELPRWGGRRRNLGVLGRCMPPPATTAGWQPSGPGRWSGPRWCWPTSSRRWRNSAWPGW
jgi:transposase